MTARPQLVIFAKAPRLGRVKTRLGRDIGPVAAWGFYRHALDHLLQRLGRDRRWLTVLAVAPDNAVGRPGWPPADTMIGQGRGDLGERMQRAFDTLPPGPVVIVGADIPDVGPDHIARAFRALGDHDAVVGPADDGGYWLIGLRRRPRTPAIFAGVRWSGPDALSDTLANLRNARVATLETLADVDTGADWARWRALNRR